LLLQERDKKIENTKKQIAQLGRMVALLEKRDEDAEDKT